MQTEVDQITRALKVLNKLKRPKLQKTEKAPGLLSRSDVRLKLGELRETITRCKQTTFDKLANSPLVSHLVVQRLPAAIAKKFLTVSEHETVITREKTVSIVNSTRRLTSLDRTGDLQETSLHYDRTETGSVMHSLIGGDSFDGTYGERPSPNASFDLTFQGLPYQDQNTFSELRSTEEDFMEKLKVRVRKSVRETLPQLKSCKSYAKIRYPAYEGEEDLEMSTHFVEIDYVDFKVRRRAIDTEAYASFIISSLVCIIDEMNSREFKLIFDDNGPKGVHLKLLTDEDLAKWRQILKAISLTNHVQFSNTGNLPANPGDSPSKTDFKRKASKVWSRTLTTREDQDDESDEENKNLYVSPEFRFNTWNTEDDEAQELLSKSITSDSSESQLFFDEIDDRVRNLTSLASLGRAEGLVNLLTKGGIFLKYGRRGRPHLRHVYVTADLKTIEWRPLNKAPYSSKKHQSTVKCLSVEIGRTTAVFKRFPKKDKEAQSFSIMCKVRTLDLELVKENLIPREVWVEAFTQLIEQKFNKSQVNRSIKKQYDPMIL